MPVFCFGFEAAWVDELTPIYPDSKVIEGRIECRLDVPAVAVAGVHLLISGLPAESSLTLPKVSGGVWSRLIAVPVEENTGLDSRTERFSGKKNPFVIRRAPFWVYDAIEPLKSDTVKVDDEGRVALRLELTGGKKRLIKCHLTAGEETVELSVDYRPHLIHLTPAGEVGFHYTNWFSLRNIGGTRGLKVWTEDWWRMLDKSAELMARGRQNTVYVPVTSMCSLDNSGELQFNRERFERYIKIFIKHGFCYFEGGHLAGRKDGKWSATNLVTHIGKHNVTSKEGLAEMTAICRQLYKEIERHGWRKQWVQHLADEPSDQLVGDYREVATLLHREMPGIPVLDATVTRNIIGAVDIWCPQIQRYQNNHDFFEERRAAGDRIWTYSCLAPGGPWLNRLLDQERLRPVYFGWAAVKFQLDGFLHWGLNYYRVDPYKQSVTIHKKGNPDNRLPAGDSHVFYPGKYAPLSSTRFEAHRIGMEDLSMLKMLMKRDPALTKILISEVFQSYDSYSKSVELYRATRLKLMLALEEKH